MQGVLDAKGRNSLSKIIFYCFIPALTFTKLAASVDLANMVRWWYLPVNVLLRSAHYLENLLEIASCTFAFTLHYCALVNTFFIHNVCHAAFLLAWASDGSVPICSRLPNSCGHMSFAP